MPFEPSDFYRTALAALHQELLASPITHAYLNGIGIRLDGSELLPDDHFELSLGIVSTVEFAHLFSVFDDSRVHQQTLKESAHNAPPGVYFTVINNRVIQPPLKNRLGIYRDSSGVADLFIDGLFVDHYFLNEHHTPPMLGTIAFALCAITAHLAKLSQISLVAAGGRGFDGRYIGYKVWPKFGFDAPLEPHEVSHVPGLAHCNSVQEVMAVDPAWWERRGSQRVMTFDLTAGSASWQKLLSYVDRRLSEGRHP
ncbi:MAG: hypothetical protein LBF16_08175 [Pseudomonadales bacterium]|jgi:hypothetical protein|nr:hypothetical protein [Pseudomonadales bacterium]